MMVCCMVVLLQEVLPQFHISCLPMIVIYFSKANISDAIMMKNIVTWYEIFLGQCINYNKLTVLFTSNTSTENRREVCTIGGSGDSKSRQIHGYANADREELSNNFLFPIGLNRAETSRME